MKSNLFILLVLGILFSLYLISSHVITPASFSFSPNVSSGYQISVNNTNAGQDSNVTQVNITIPSKFTFISGSDATDASGTFTNTSSVLSWTNNSVYLINGSGTKSFQFDADASDFGDYNLTVTVVNRTGNYEYNVSVTIEDTTDPNIVFESSTPANNATLNQTFIPVGVSATDDVAVDTITVFLYNSTDQVTSTSTTNSSVIVNFTMLSDKDYYINATVNDTSGNSDSTPTRKITINTSGTSSQNQTNGTETPVCTPNWDCTDWSPEECPGDGIQTRTCTDLNDCGTNKPIETFDCTQQEESSNFFPIIITFVVALVVIAGFVAFLYFRKQGGTETKEDNAFRKNFPPSTSPLKHTINKPQIKRPMFPVPRLPPRRPFRKPMQPTPRQRIPRNPPPKFNNPQR